MGRVSRCNAAGRRNASVIRLKDRKRQGRSQAPCARTVKVTMAPCFSDTVLRARQAQTGETLRSIVIIADDGAGGFLGGGVGAAMLLTRPGISAVPTHTEAVRGSRANSA